MDEVGRRFESGRMQLPFVLRSAEAMRAAFDVLREHLPAGSHKQRGTLLLATVRGDVHDIGKNLVDMIVASNGFNVVNLGVRQTPEDVIAAARKHEPDAIGLSGLLVESARAMKEYVADFADAGLAVPVICGGAALDRAFVDKELRPAYTGSVYYAKDALEGLRIMQAITGPKPPAAGRTPRVPGARTGAGLTPDQAAAWNQPRIFGAYARSLTKIVHADIRTYALHLDRDRLFRKRWRMLGPKATRAERREAERILDKFLATGHDRGLWHGVMVYGLYEAGIDGSELVVVHPRAGQELTRLEFAPAFARRLQRKHGRERFHVALQVVTVGTRVVQESRRLARQKRIHDQFLLHGLGAELTEVLAGYCQGRLPRLPGWRKTVRYSPGYPVWPELSEQKKIFALLRPERIGVTLTRTFQMVPEYSTSAIVLPA
jgi:5-methyltetrahydrofolate--homocysteine methyltransferase